MQIQRNNKEKQRQKSPEEEVQQRSLFVVHIFRMRGFANLPPCPPLLPSKFAFPRTNAISHRIAHSLQPQSHTSLVHPELETAVFVAVCMLFFSFQASLLSLFLALSDSILSVGRFIPTGENFDARVIHTSFRRCPFFPSLFFREKVATHPIFYPFSVSISLKIFCVFYCEFFSH